MIDLSKKVALVTAGNSEMGYAAAKLLTEAGASVVIIGRNRAGIQKMAESLGVKGLVIDQNNTEDLEILAKEIEHLHQRIDILLLNTGIGPFIPEESATKEVYDSIMDTTIQGSYLTAQKFVPMINKGGSVIFNACVIPPASEAPDAGVYAGNTAALKYITSVLTRELAPQHILVNTIWSVPLKSGIFDKFSLGEQEGAPAGNETLNSFELELGKVFKVKENGC